MNRVTLISIIIVSVVIGFVGGYFFGANQGEKATTQKLEPIINQVFPKPAGDIRNASGVVKNIKGRTVEMEILDPSDYIPHADGSPMKKITLIGITNNVTKISVVELSNGFKQKPATLADLKVGDSIGFGTSENLQGKESVMIAYIEILR